MVAPPDATAPVRQRQKRRVLGDAWRDWDHSDHSPPVDTRAGSAPFLLVESLLAVFFAGCWLLLVWVAQPRLESLGLATEHVLLIGLIGIVILLLPPLLLWGHLAGIPWPVGIVRAMEHWIVLTWNPDQFVAACLRFSRDRLGHSFVLVANRLSIHAQRAQPGDELLLLAPRCLRPEHMRQLRQAANEAGARFVVATGGEEARAAVAESAPVAVLAVACERDLVEGMRDVLTKLTVLGLANRRPDGPCRNSEIDLQQAQHFLGMLKQMTCPS
ncbi:MAG: DUF116 domain-containing protein [Candidatus Eisenbacteria sp.]|nr:DUF116 domain-containing protein [Candidatus Eisenbacteria bacterium]